MLGRQVSLISMFLSGLSLSFAHSYEKLGQPLKVVEVRRVLPSSITQTMRLIGTLKAKNESVLVAKSQGTVEFVLPAGTKVKKGDLVLAYSCCLQKQNLELMQKGVQLANEKFNRAKVLFERRVIAKVSYELANNQLLDAQKRMTDASLDLDKTQFIAPFNGITGVFKVRTGAQVAEGDVLGTVYDPQNIIVTFDIPGSVLSKVKPGQTVLIHNQPFSLMGVQTLIDPQTHMAPAYLEFSCRNCILGSHIDLDLVLEQKNNVHVLPLEALVLRGHQKFVYVIQNDVAHLRKVQTGIREKDRVEITEGLKTGDMIVVKGTNRLYDGLKIKVVQEGI